MAGEAGIGKTALLREFTASASARVLWARCEPLFTPRPLGPVLELAEAIGTETAARAVDAGGPYDVAKALFPELAAVPSVVVFEDAHWADEATLDVVRLFARRVTDAPMLLVLSYRDDELDRSHPLRSVLGNLPASGQVTRLQLAGLSAPAVAKLAGPGNVEAAEPYRRTAGNPFYVTEVLAAATAAIPHSVRDAVLARAAPLRGAARDLLDAASVVPGTIETWLLYVLVPTTAEMLDECLGTGVLVLAGDRVEFRHEIERQVVEDSLAPGRRQAMNHAALTALTARPADQQDLTRLAHHAAAAQDAEAVLKYVPAAAASAVAAGAYREAARLFARALRFADLLDPDRHAALPDAFAEAAYFTELGSEATAALRKAVAIYAECGNVIRQGDALRRLASQVGKDGAYAESEALTVEAVTLLEQQPPSRELAKAYNAMAAITGIADDDGAVLWGKKALEVAEQVGCLDAIGDTLSLSGTAELRQGNLGGLEKVEHSRASARQAANEAGEAQTLVRAAAVLSGREAGHAPLLAQAAALAQDMPPGRHGLQIAALRAELAWLAGAAPRSVAEAADPGEAVPAAVRWFAGETEAWRHRAGLDSGDPAHLPEPYRLELTGDAEGAARWWQERDCAYDAALALACSGDRLLMRRALDMLLDLGAHPAAAVVTRQLRGLGEQGLRRGDFPQARRAQPRSGASGRARARPGHRCRLTAVRPRPPDDSRSTIDLRQAA